MLVADSDDKEWKSWRGVAQKAHNVGERLDKASKVGYGKYIPWKAIWPHLKTLPTAIRTGATLGKGLKFAAAVTRVFGVIAPIIDGFGWAYLSYQLIHYVLDRYILQTKPACRAALDKLQLQCE